MQEMQLHVWNRLLGRIQRFVMAKSQGAHNEVWSFDEQYLHPSTLMERNMDESRKQFQIMAAKELCMHPEMVEKDRKGNGYNYKPLNLWWKIWKASRAAIDNKNDEEGYEAKR